MFPLRLFRLLPTILLAMIIRAPSASAGDITYPGREPDAAWRREALARIEAHRKNNFTLKLTDVNGKPIAVNNAALRLRRHHFGFGSATPASMYSADTEDGRRYREIVDRNFSIVVFENDLKDMWWGKRARPGQEEKTRRELDIAFAWLEQRHIPVRGHYLMQVPVPSNLRGLDDDAEVRRHFLETTRDRLAFAGNRVIEWDVINHPVAWRGAELLSTRPGLRQLDQEIFTLARSVSRLPMWVNEDQLFRPGRQFDGTFRYLQDLKSAGFTIDGLGNQAHIEQSHLPSPEHILAVTDKFATLVPRQAITEFDLIADDEQLAADYTRDILIATFSHPAYSSFLLWGFWEGRHWKPEAASWKKDWTIKGRGKAWEEWVGQRWRTTTTLTTGQDGMARWRGFPGWYELSVVENGTTAVHTFHVSPSRTSATVDVSNPSGPLRSGDN